MAHQVQQHRTKYYLITVNCNSLEFLESLQVSVRSKSCRLTYVSKTLRQRQLTPVGCKDRVVSKPQRLTFVLFVFVHLFATSSFLFRSWANSQHLCCFYAAPSATTSNQVLFDYCKLQRSCCFQTTTFGFRSVWLRLLVCYFFRFSFALGQIRSICVVSTLHQVQQHQTKYSLNTGIGCLAKSQFVPSHVVYLPFHLQRNLCFRCFASPFSRCRLRSFARRGDVDQINSTTSSCYPQTDSNLVLATTVRFRKNRCLQLRTTVLELVRHQFRNATSGSRGN